MKNYILLTIIACSFFACQTQKTNKTISVHSDMNETNPQSATKVARYDTIYVENANGDLEMVVKEKRKKKKALISPSSGKTRIQSKSKYDTSYVEQENGDLKMIITERK